MSHIKSLEQDLQILAETLLIDKYEAIKTKKQYYIPI